MGMALKRVFEFAFYDVFMFQANYSLQLLLLAFFGLLMIVDF